MNAQVFMLRSFSDEQRALLLSACTAVVYTPQHEHFGIVPLEAMAAGRPVIACDSGGPRETVLHGKTGLLCDPTPAAFADAMLTLQVQLSHSRVVLNCDCPVHGRDGQQLATTCSTASWDHHHRCNQIAVAGTGLQVYAEMDHFLYLVSAVTVRMRAGCGDCERDGASGQGARAAPLLAASIRSRAVQHCG